MYGHKLLFLLQLAIQIAFFSLLFFPRWGSAAPPTREGMKPNQSELFEFQADIVEAIEDGPVVIRFTYRYLGSTQTMIGCTLHRPDIEITIPKSWEFFPGIRGNLGPPRIRIKPHQSWSVQLCLHPDYKNILSGEYPLVVAWDVGADHANIHLKQDLLLKVAKATPENLKKMRLRFGEELRKERLTTKELEDLLRRVMDTPHRESFWCMLDIMDYSGNSYEDSAAVAHFGSSGFWNRPNDAVSPRADVALPVMIEYLNRAEPRQAATLIRMLPDNIANPERAPKKLIDSLCKAPNPFVRALLYAQFPKDLELSVIDGILDDLRRLYDPPPKEPMQMLLKQLEDPAFQVRERATKALIQLGEPAIPFLMQELQKQLPAESDQRVKTILERIRRDVPSFLAKSTLAALAKLDTPESKRILLALTQNQQEGWAAKEAKAELAKKMKINAPPK